MTPLFSDSSPASTRIRRNNSVKIIERFHRYLVRRYHAFRKSKPHSCRWSAACAYGFTARDGVSFASTSHAAGFSVMEASESAWSTRDSLSHLSFIQRRLARQAPPQGVYSERKVLLLLSAAAFSEASREARRNSPHASLSDGVFEASRSNRLATAYRTPPCFGPFCLPHQFHSW